MTQIVLTAEQTAALDSAQEPVAICRPDGSVAAVISPQAPFIAPQRCPLTPEQVAAAVRESDGPGPFFSTQEVLDYLRASDSQQF